MKRLSLLVLAAVSMLAAPATLRAQTARSEAEAIRDRDLQKEAERRAEVLRAEEGLSDLEASRASLTTLESLTKDLSARMNALLASDEGKAVASHRPSLEAFTRLRNRFEDDAPSDSELSLWRKTLSIYTEVFKARATKGGALPLDPKEKAELYQARSKVDSRLALLSECSTTLDGVLVTTQALPPVDFAKAPTLGETLTQFEAARLKAENEIVSEAKSEGEKEGRQALFEAVKQARIEEELAKARREQAETANALKRLEALWAVREGEKDQRHQEELTELRAAVERASAADKEKELQIDAEVKRRVAEAEKRHRDELQKLTEERDLFEAELQARGIKVKIEKDKILDAATHEQFIAECHTTEVGNLLEPFLAKGLWNPGGQKNWTSDPKPMSYKAILGSQALTDDSMPSLRKLVHLMQEQQGAERPRREPPKGWEKNVAYVADLRKLQSTLKRLGPTLVEQHLLEP